MAESVIYENLEASLREIQLSYSQLGILVDENTKKYCLPRISKYLDNYTEIQIRSGEENKNIRTCMEIWEALTAYRFDRKSLLINLGGGVIGDMGGFCASTFKRGIDFINIPTTLLSQVDASVGGKLGIDFKGYKNHIGLFRDPNYVLIDPGFLKTLGERELKSGFAELIKHALIHDADQWQKLLEATNWKVLDFSALIPASVAIKEKIVGQDPEEGGLRKILNFGHTVGHAIETFFLEDKEKRLLHGEAIALGMICEAYLSKQLCGLTEQSLQTITNYLLVIFDHKSIDPTHFGYLIDLMKQDKKNQSNQMLMSLLIEPGRCDYNIEVQPTEIEQSLIYLNQLDTNV